MVLKQIKSLSFNDNDVYQLETYSDKIIINDDYSGIRILDLNLNTIKVIPIADGLIARLIYKKENGNSVLIYDSKNHRLILIDLENPAPKMIDIQEFKGNHIFTDLYHWQNEKIIFALPLNLSFYSSIENNNIFYELNLTDLSLRKISSQQVQSIATSFFNFYNICKQYNTLAIDSYKQTFIFKKNKNLIGFYDHKNNKNYLYSHKVTDPEDIYYHDGQLLIFNRWSKNVAFPKYNISIKPAHPGYYCLRIKILDNGDIALLQTNQDNHKLCNIGIYTLE